MTGIILAGGCGNRLKQSYDANCCKPLVKIQEKTLIEFSLEALIDLQIRDVCIVVGKESDLIQTVIGSHYKGLNISYVHQTEADGLINALCLALEAINDDNVILQLADEIFVGLNTETIKSYINNPGYDFYCGFTYEDSAEKIKINYSIETDEHFHILKCIEKPETVINNLKGTGFCVFSNRSLDILKNADSNIPMQDLCDFINFLIEKKHKGLAVCIAKKEFNVNTFEDLKEAMDYLQISTDS